MVIVEEPKEEGCSNAFFAITEGMVLGDEVKQHGSFLFYTGIEFLTSEGLIDLSDAALERVVFLIAKQDGASEFLAQAIDGLHRILVGSMEGLLLGSLIDSKSLVIIVVKSVKSVGVIRHHLEEGIRLVVRQQRLILYCAS